ncbi:hypothetical protein M569_09083, partial [Genlisea aurea]
TCVLFLRNDDLYTLSLQVQVHIVQRGAVPPLIKMLQSTDDYLKEISAFVLGRLAQDTHNQAGIAQNNGIMPLLELLESENAYVQRHAAFALHSLAQNEDNAASLVTLGAVPRLRNGGFILQCTKDSVYATLKTIGDNIHGQVLCHLLHMMRAGKKKVRRLVALSLALVCSPNHYKTVFIDDN